MSNKSLDEFKRNILRLKQGDPEYIMQELSSRITQLQKHQEETVNKHFTGDDLNQFEKVLNNIAENNISMRDVYLIEALMIKYL